MDDGVTVHRISYPPKAGDPGTSGGSNALDVASTKLRFTFWRPQRLPIPGSAEQGLMDMGRLSYIVGNPVNQGSRSCKLADLSAIDPTLVPGGDGFYEFLTDTADDAPANPASTMSFTADLGACAARDGASLAGEISRIGIEARTESGANSGQSLWVRFPS